MGRQVRAFFSAIYELYADSGFSMAGAVAYSFVLSLFPFVIFLGAVAGYFGGEALAERAVAQLFQIVPEQVARTLEPEVMAVMGRSRLGLLTFGALIALVFATSAIESLRAALNTAYRVKETKSYPACLVQSAFLVLFSALGMLVFAWGIVVGPQLARQYNLGWLIGFTDQGWWAIFLRYFIVISVIGAQLFAYHLFLAAGDRRIGEVWPGVVLSVVLWILAAQVFAWWMSFSDYSRFYAGLTHLMVTLVFFQLAAIVIILGAEFNRGLSEMRHSKQNSGNGRQGDPVVSDTVGKDIVAAPAGVASAGQGKIERNGSTEAA